MVPGVLAEFLELALEFEERLLELKLMFHRPAG
jgi:hypothetical protein